MQRKVDPETLAAFIAEACSYLPAILNGLEAYQANPEQADRLEEAYRHAHTLKGASAMVGLAELSHVAYRLEETLEGVIEGRRTLDGELLDLCRGTIAELDRCLDGIANGTLAEETPAVAEEAAAPEPMPSVEPEPAPELDEDPLASLELLGPDTPPEVPFPSEPEPNLLDGLEAFAPELPPLEEPPAPVAEEPLAEDIPEPEPQDEVSPELVEVFALEAEDHLRNMSALLPQLEQQPGNRDLVQDIRRSAHTLKGAAAMVGFQGITQLAHRMEDLLDQLFEGARPPTSEVIRLLFASTDALEDMAGGKAQAGAVRELYARYDAMLGTVAEVETPAEAEEAAAPSTAAPRRQGQLLRVPLDRLDDLVKLVSELVINRSAFEQRIGEFARQVGELHPSTERLRRVSHRLETQFEARALGGNRLAFHGGPATGTPVNRLPLSFTTHGFDDLEFDRYTEFHLLSRELAETTSDIQTVGGELGHLLGDFDSYLNRQARLSSEIEDKLMRLRMVPLATLASRLHRTVRNVAAQQGKQVELVLEGESTELDKTVLEEMADPLLHLLRNAVDHGIEPAELRQARGKSACGTIRLRAFHEGSQVVIRIADDGRGIDPEGLRAAAVAKGFAAAADAAALSDDELRTLVFLPGFSTAAEVSEVSGRGVGLDVVKAHVHRLKGNLTLDSQPGCGTTFTIRLPMTLAITRALLVKAHKETFAVPLDAVRQILRLEPGEAEHVGAEPVVRVGSQVYPLLSLGKLLNLKQAADDTAGRQPVLILDVGGRQVALAVDRLVGGREIVIKNLGTHLRRIPGVTGATLMGDGTVVLILNPLDLLRDASPTAAPIRATPRSRAASRDREALNVLVVDDSPSVRRVVSNLLRSAGWNPTSARDGLEALEVLHHAAAPPDLILLDIEMPRMDGYELLSTLKAQEAFRHVPVVFVTSRAGEKHRRKALDLGAAGYVVKPYRDEALLDVVRRLVREARQAVPS